MKNMPEKQTGDKRDLGLAAPVAFSLSWLSSNGRFMVMQNSSLLKALFYDGLSKWNFRITNNKKETRTGSAIFVQNNFTATSRDDKICYVTSTILMNRFDGVINGHKQIFCCICNSCPFLRVCSVRQRIHVNIYFWKSLKQSSIEPWAKIKKKHKKIAVKTSHYDGRYWHLLVTNLMISLVRKYGRYPNFDQKKSKLPNVTKFILINIMSN